MGLNYQRDGQWNRVAVAESVFPTAGPTYGIPQPIYDRVLYANTFSNQDLIVVPRPITRDVIIDQIGIFVQTAAAATVVRLGIYASDDDGRPSDLIVDAGTVDASTTGQKIITLSPTVRLNAGMVYTAWVPQGGAPRIRSAIKWSTPPIPSNATVFFEGDELLLFQSNVSGALPASFTGAGTGTANHALIWLRVAEVL